MIEQLGPREKQWGALGLSEIADKVCRLARAISTDGDMHCARFEFLSSMRVAVTLAERFPMPAEDLHVTVVVNGEAIGFMVPADTPVGWVCDMGVALTGNWAPGKLWERRTKAGANLFGRGPTPVECFETREFYVTWPIGAGG